MNEVLIAILLLVPIAAPASGRAIRSGPPEARQLSAASAQVGHTVLVQGANLAGSDLVVRFGRAQALGVNPGRSRQSIKVDVPIKIDPRDPDAVAVTVFVDGREADYPDGPLRFTYAVPTPLPVVADYATGDPDAPRSVQAGVAFEVTLTGVDFTLGRRMPISCLAIGPYTEAAARLSGTPTNTEVAFRFAGLSQGGDYRLLVGFSDGAAAGIDAPGFVRGVSFAHPPALSDVEAASEEATVSCDLTREMEMDVCALTGATGVQALSPGIVLEGSFTDVRLAARVTDPDSTPAQNDILWAAASYMKPDPYGPPTEVWLAILDDGSSNADPFQQQAGLLQDCSDATADTCTCRPATYLAVSGDAMPQDALYTRTYAVLNPATSVLLRDCILRERHEPSLLVAPGDSLDFKFEAIDRAGNITSWPALLPVLPGTSEVACAGDPCGCCLMLSSDPASPPPVGCLGLEGMTAPSLPAGICRSF